MSFTFVTLAEAARSLEVAPSTLRHQIRLRRLTAIKIGRGWFVTPEEIETYRTRHKRVAA